MKKFLNKQRAQEAEETEERQDFEEAQETGEVKGPRISQKKKRCKNGTCAKNER